MSLPAPSAPRRQAFQPDDLYSYLAITQLHCSPRAERAACTVRSVERDANTYRTKLWIFGLEGGMEDAIQVTQGEGNDHSPRWSPSGSDLAFVSTRSGSPQIHLMAMEAGGEAWQLTHLPQGVANFAWAPDGDSLLATAAVAVDPEWRGARSAEPAAARQAHAPEIAWKLPYKSDGIGYLLAREIHLFRIDARTGAAQQITDGPFDVLAHDVSPDGQRVAYVRTREGRFAHATDLWVCTVQGQEPVRLTESHAHVLQPAWSPTGRYIAFTGAVLAGDAEVRLWLYDTTTRQTRQLGDVEVADPASVHWPDGDEAVVFVRAHRGRHQIVRMTLQGEVQPLLERDHQLGAFGWTRRHFAMAVHHPSLPCELHACQRAQPCADSFRRVSDLNPWWRERTPIEAEARRFEVPGAEGATQEIEGWLLRAQGASGGAPLLNDIHGGPASYVLLDFDTNVYWQVLCSQGWSVLALNAVGSASFGHGFSHQLEGHWGTRDMPQHLAAIVSLQAEGVCDDRLAVCGKSYGGYLTAWAISHTDLFKAAVVMAPVGNIETHYGTSDGGYYADPFYMATAPRFDRAKARSLSPLQHIERAKTPTLFMQGKDDERCPKCQSEELFVSLLCSGDTPAELVLYPNEGHGFLGSGAPHCRADAARRIVEWVSEHAQHVPEPSSANPANALT